jgi:DNA anti-recombination protein RmuC
MSPSLQRMLSDLRLLSIEERWNLLSHLVNQLRSGVAETEQMQSETSPDQNAADVDAILRATQGCWGNVSIEEIDASLNRQRQFDWEYQRRKTLQNCHNYYG